MFQKKNLKYIPVLTLLVLSLSACSTAVNYNNCPVFPIGGKKVAEELKNVPYDGYENTWEWIARLNKLKQELELCKK